MGRFFWVDMLFVFCLFSIDLNFDKVFEKSTFVPCLFEAKRPKGALALSKDIERRVVEVPPLSLKP